MSTEKRYLTWLFICLVATISLVASFNYVVNPYGIFSAPTIPGFNAVKTQAAQRGYLTKAYGIEKTHPHGLIIGNSRAEIGFDPEHPAWPANARPVYNAALPGTGIDTALRYLKHSTTSNLQRVVLGIEFLDFRINPDMPAQPPELKPVLPPKERLISNFDAIFSIDSAFHSLATVRGQREAHPTSLTAAGFNPMREYIDIARNEGYYALFRQRAEENARNFIRGNNHIFKTGTQTSSEFETLKTLLYVASEKNIQLDLVIYPYHAEMLVLFEQTDLWPLFEDWKREIVAIVSAHKARYPNSAITLWDFSTPCDLTSEKIPAKSDVKTVMKNYWEAGHFKKELGDKVLDRILASKPDHTSTFGIVLTADNVESSLATSRFLLNEYTVRQPEVVDSVKDVVAKVRPPTKTANWVAP